MASSPGINDPYLPTDKTFENVSYAQDTRDANLDGNDDQQIMSMLLQAIKFRSNSSQVQSKYSTSSITAKRATQLVQGPAAVPEGGDYQYEAEAYNPGAEDNISKTYLNGTFLDILPYANDVKVYDGRSGEAVERGSTWNGWISDLDSIKMSMMWPIAVRPLRRGRS